MASNITVCSGGIGAFATVDVLSFDKPNDVAYFRRVGEFLRPEPQIKFPNHRPPMRRLPLSVPYIQSTYNIQYVYCIVTLS